MWALFAHAVYSTNTSWPVFIPGVRLMKRAAFDHDTRSRGVIIPFHVVFLK